MNGLKLWSFNIVVKVLEYEFSTHKLIWAIDYKKAYQIARDYAKEYYGEGEHEGVESFVPDTFAFNGGCPMVEFSAPIEESDVETWKNRVMSMALITRKSVVH